MPVKGPENHLVLNPRLHVVLRLCQDERQKSAAGFQGNKQIPIVIPMWRILCAEYKSKTCSLTLFRTNCLGVTSLPQRRDWKMRAGQKSTRQVAANPVYAHVVTSLSHCATQSRVPHTGIYEIIHHGHHREAREAVLIAGNPIPRCEGCGEPVQFRLLRSVPHSFQGGFRIDA